MKRTYKIVILCQWKTKKTWYCILTNEHTDYLRHLKNRRCCSSEKITGPITSSTFTSTLGRLALGPCAVWFASRAFILLFVSPLFPEGVEAVEPARSIPAALLPGATRAPAEKSTLHRNVKTGQFLKKLNISAALEVHAQEKTMIGKSKSLKLVCNYPAYAIQSTLTTTSPAAHCFPAFRKAFQ